MKLQMDIDALHAFVRREFPQVDGQLRVENLSKDGLEASLLVNESHLRPGGTVSGPTMFMLADVTVYLAILSRIGPVALAVTTNCAMDFMRKPAAGQSLRCAVRVLKLGRSLAVCDALIFSKGQAAPVARANMTYAIPPQRD
ncbi:PaaI family thioesterase [Yoonia sp.]|uniref:PaaI family thioesterase n=1 Tax=Yoonia sp. TaxID=2212373 RepID=UPI002FD9D7D0